jgi:cell division protein FtsW
MTCIALGIILSVTRKEEEIAQDEAEKEKREIALQKLIDKQLQEDEEEEKINENEDFSIEDKANPLEPILKKN